MSVATRRIRDRWEQYAAIAAIVISLGSGLRHVDILTERILGLTTQVEALRSSFVAVEIRLAIEERKSVELETKQDGILVELSRLRDSSRH